MRCFADYESEKWKWITAFDTGYYPNHFGAGQVLPGGAKPRPADPRREHGPGVYGCADRVCPVPRTPVGVRQNLLLIGTLKTDKVTFTRLAPAISLKVVGVK